MCWYTGVGCIECVVYLCVGVLSMLVYWCVGCLECFGILVCGVLSSLV